MFLTQVKEENREVFFFLLLNVVLLWINFRSCIKVLSSIHFQLYVSLFPHFGHYPLFWLSLRKSYYTSSLLKILGANTLRALSKRLSWFGKVFLRRFDIRWKVSNLSFFFPSASSMSWLFANGLLNQLHSLWWSAGKTKNQEKRSCQKIQRAFLLILLSSVFVAPQNPCFL